MSETRALSKLIPLVKPTLDTPFHIDLDWWEKEGLDIRVDMYSHLCEEHRAIFSDHLDTEEIDWVDARTGEVKRVDGLMHTLRVHCSQQPDYIGNHTSLVDAVFRVFLANENTPLTCRELGDMIGRPPKTILRTLSGLWVYKGLRPVQEG